MPASDSATIAAVFAFGPLAVVAGVGFWQLRRPSLVIADMEPGTKTAEDPARQPVRPIPLAYGRRSPGNEWSIPEIFLWIVALWPAVTAALAAGATTARSLSLPALLAAVLLLMLHLAMPIAAVMALDWPARHPRRVGLAFLVYVLGSLLYLLVAKHTAFWAAGRYLP